MYIVMRIYNIYSYVHKLLFHRIVIIKNGLTKHQRHGGMKVQRRPPGDFCAQHDIGTCSKASLKRPTKGNESFTGFNPGGNEALVLLAQIGSNFLYLYVYVLYFDKYIYKHVNTHI